MPIRHPDDPSRSDGPGQALPRFPNRFPLARLPPLRADRVQCLLLRMSRRSAGAARVVPGAGCDGSAAARRDMTQRLLFVNARQVVTCAGPPRGRRGPEMADAVVRTGVAVLVDGDRIAAVDDEATLRRETVGAVNVDCAQGVLTPGFVDSHTHAIFG